MELILSRVRTLAVELNAKPNPKPSEEGMEQVITPFCDGSACSMYMLIGGGKDGRMKPVGKAGTLLSTESEVAKNGSFLPLPGEYKKIASVSCGTCPPVEKC
uniref:AcnX domain-containing protein n=1 Tax=Steinernema glaseri TaxID=37863 RepID=A0A1I8AWE8_9BILA